MHLPQHTCSYYCVGTTHAVRVLTITSDVEASWTIARALAQRYYGEYVVVDLLPAREADVAQWRAAMERHGPMTTSGQRPAHVPVPRNVMYPWLLFVREPAEGDHAAS